MHQNKMDGLHYAWADVLSDKTVDRMIYQAHHSNIAAPLEVHLKYSGK
jgi:hypothetical protein